MPIETSTNLKPKQGALVVCAGTVTCTTVSGMGAGFTLFKELFSENSHCKNLAGGWQMALQESLDNYHQGKNEMPPYQRLAQQASYLGGVATVPYKAGNQGLTFDEPASTEEREEHFKEQYKAAILAAVLDALELQRPLFIQPLGIGVYGWDAKEAARIFAEAITKADPLDEVEISIPIFNAQAGSKDRIFSETLAKEMAKRGRSSSNS